MSGQKPVEKVTAGQVSAALWENEITAGNGSKATVLKASVQRRYKDRRTANGVVEPEVIRMIDSYQADKPYIVRVMHLHEIDKAIRQAKGPGILIRRFGGYG